MAIDALTHLPHSAVTGPEMNAPRSVLPGLEMDRVIEAGGMGPGSPEMRGTGRAVCRLIQDGLWFDCDFEQDQVVADGTFVLTWRLHWVTGWDRAAVEYRASSADNNGPNLAIYRGRIDRDRLVYEFLQQGRPSYPAHLDPGRPRSRDLRERVHARRQELEPDRGIPDGCPVVSRGPSFVDRRAGRCLDWPPHGIDREE